MREPPLRVCSRRVIAVLLLAAAATALGTALGEAAAAHPFGAPAVSKLTAEGREVTVTWSAEPDDLVALGRQVGAVAGPVAKADQGRVAAELDGLPEVARYLAEHLSVRQDGAPCVAGDVDTAEISDGGARLGFTCAAKVDRVEFTVTALTDIDRAYRNVSVTSFGKGALHGVDDPTHVLSLSGGGGQAEAQDGPLLTTDLTELLSGRTPLLLGLLIAGLVGAAHACAPGHGKTLTAAYLVAGQGSARAAVWLGAVVAVMHTFSVAVLAVGWWALAETAPDLGMVTRWLQLAGALLVLVVGLGLLRRHTADRGELVTHGHGHGHGHEHDLGHVHEHSHVLVEPRDLLTRRGLVLIGTSGGLLPSPSAFLVLLVGLLTGHVFAGIAMVVAFGVGMALTLTAVGLLVLRGRDALVERAARSPVLERWTQRLPLLGAIAIVVGGTVATVVAAAQLIA